MCVCIANACVRVWLSVSVSLPQGPFLPAVELRRRLSRPPCQSLRAAEPFETTETAARDQRRLGRVHCVTNQP